MVVSYDGDLYLGIPLAHTQIERLEMNWRQSGDKEPTF